MRYKLIKDWEWCGKRLGAGTYVILDKKGAEQLSEDGYIAKIKTKKKKIKKLKEDGGTDIATNN